MRRPAGLLALLVLSAGWLHPVRAAGPAAHPDGAGAAPWTHEIDVTLEPSAHRLEATDRIAVASGGEPLRFALHKGLAIVSFTIDGVDAKGALAPAQPAPPGAKSHLTTYEGPAVRPGQHLMLAYRGEIHDPVRAETSAGYVAGDATTGFIGEEGVFLDGGTGWVPIVETPGASLAMYNVTARAPEPWRVVTQGRRRTIRSPKGVAAARYDAEVASDSVALVAGRYSVKSIEHEGVTISACFFEEEAPLADLFLRRTAEYIDRFAALLAPYPYSRFDIVENFFTTGYGFPSFTLLGSDVVKLGEMALRPGYVDHEVMHCWWGNYVYPDAATGNWSEGLTTYYANYLAQETASPEQAADYRRGIAQKYSLRVRPDVDYPLSRFTEKTRDLDNEIGYGKAAMVFHMLRRMSGDEAFFRTMRAMTVKFGGQRAGWSDFRAAFEEATGRDLKAFFAEWIERPGLPSLSLAEARTEAVPGGGSYRVTGRVEQEGDPGAAPYHLTIPLVVRTARGRTEHAVELNGRVASFDIATDAPPLELRLDPDMQVPRRLLPAEIPPSLNAALEDGAKVVLIPATAGPADPYAKLASTAEAAKGATIVREGAAPAGVPPEASVVVLGRPDRSAAGRALLAKLASAPAIGESGFTVAGESFSGPEYSLLYSARRPDDPNHVVTFFFGMSDESLARSRNLFYYGWDSWVVFKAGRPERRGTSGIDSPRSRRLLVRDDTAAPGGIAGAALLEHARALAAPAMEGRRPGTPGHEAAAAYIEKFFAEHGVASAGAVAPFVEGYRHNFELPLVDVDPNRAAASIEVVHSGGDSRYPAFPFPFAPGPPPGETETSRGEVVFLDPDDLASMATSARPPRLEGGTVITVERALPAEPEPASPRGRPEIDPRAAALLADEVRGAARLGASTLIVTRGGEGPSMFEPFLSFASRPSSSDAEAIAARRKTGDFPGTDLYFAGRASRLPFAGLPPPLLVLSAGPELGSDLLGRHAFARHAEAPLVDSEPGYRPILLDIELSAAASLKVERLPMANVIGYLEGADPARKGEAVLVTAHYDAMGRSADGSLLPGASDNAAGVAALLEIARWLADPARRPARSVVLAATDGEEWGLAGSRALAGRLAEMSVRPIAVVNVDSIGSPGVTDPYLIGGSRYPAIRDSVECLADALGIGLSRDIDAYAFEYGSDFYPFHLAGVPSVGFFAANYRALHRPGDDLTSLDAGALERTARLVALTVRTLAM